jgi:hypothetical protein
VEDPLSLVAAMSYHPIQIDPRTPKLVKDFIRSHLDMQFHDVHCMLRLPILNQELGAGCNFSAATFLLSLISGISMTLYKQRGGSGKLFKELLEIHYPWEQEPSGGVTKQDGPDDLYNLFRNPLAHSLGILDPRRKRPAALGVGKGTYPEDLIERIEQSATRPADASATIMVAHNSKTLRVEGLYWGIREMVRRLTADAAAMSGAAKFIASL